MANPSRKPTPNIRPNIRPSFTVITGGGQTTPGRGSLKAVNDQEENPEENPQETSVPEREETPTTTTTRETWNDNTTPQDQKKKPGFVRRAFRNHRWLTGAGVGVGLISLPVLLLSLLPLKLEMFIKNITAISVVIPGTAIDIRLEELLVRALATRAIMAANPGDAEAGLVFCRGGGIACTLFQTYTTDYYEKKLGITLKVEVDGRVEIGGRASKWTVIEPGENNLDGVVNKIEVGSNKEMKKLIKEHVNTAAKHHSWIDRYVTRKLIQKRLGVVFWRGPPFVEQTVNRYETAKTNIKAAIIRGTIGRVAPRLSTYLTCMMGSPDVCKKLRTDYNKTVSTVPGDPAENSEIDPDSEEGKAAQAEYDAKTAGAESIGEVDIDPDVDAKNPVKGLITKRILAIAGGGVAIAGVLDMIFSAVEAIDEGALEQIWYDMSTLTYMGFSTETITAYEKWKAGDMDLTTLEALNKMFNNAEKAPLQQAENGGLDDTGEGVVTKCASVNGVENEQVNTKLKPGQLVCDEQKMVRDYSSAFTNNPAWQVIAEVAPVWNSTVGVGFDFVNGVVGTFLGAIPGFSQLMDLVGGLAEPVITWMIGLIFEPPLVGDEATGAQNYTALSAGIRATQNSTMEEGVSEDGTAGGGGGSVLTDSEISAIHTRSEKENKEYFDNQPLLARIFSLDLSGSFAQKFVSQLPTTVNSLARLPMTSLGQVLSGTNVSAAPSSEALNPFGLPTYGYALNDPVLFADPSIYTEEYCKTTADERAASYSKDDGDILPTYKKADPCALEKLVVGAALSAEGVTDDKYSLKPLESQEGVVENVSAGGSGSAITVVVNKQNPNTPQNYVPTGLVGVTKCVADSRQLRSEAAAAFEKMSQAAKADGVPRTICAQSAYRSYDTQVSVYNNHVATKGQAEADKVSARPGYSEHQTGLALDIIATDKAENFETTAEGIWLAANSWKYGFILRYPSGKTAITGYDFEPWHFRYIGVAAATEMRNKGVTTLEEFYGVTGGTTYAQSPSSNNMLLASFIKPQNNIVLGRFSSTSLSMEPWLL